MQTKLSLAMSLYSKHINAFACPVCGSAFIMAENSLKCNAGHSYDISKQGTVHFMGRRDCGVYNTEFFSCRRYMQEIGIFTPALSVCAEMLMPARSGLILDAGCGEGYSSDYLHTALSSDVLGIDISSDGIKAAGATYGGRCMFTVGDIARLPLSDGQVSGILNMLTPASYGQFRRVLAHNGLLVKVVPTESHLAQIKELAGLPLAVKDKTLEHFLENCSLIDSRHISYSFSVEQCHYTALVGMVPLEQERKQAVLKGLDSYSSFSVQIDLKAYLGAFT